jgi:hypothetical protein
MNFELQNPNKNRIFLGLDFWIFFGFWVRLSGVI